MDITLEIGSSISGRGNELDNLDEPVAEGQSAFGFTGNWRPFVPIVLSNLALTIVTLGIYRFWGQVRERKFLWSHSRFIDAQLEWTGTGLEVFIGFIMGAVLLGVPFLILQFGVQALMLQGHEGIAVLVGLGSFVLLYYFYGLAKFRALRYRLGRTYWRGIRGGSNNAGMKYGWSYIWKNVVGWLPAGLLIPWSMTSLWNERWNLMSFGNHAFHCDSDFSPLMKRYLLFYLSPIFLMILLIVLMGVGVGFASAFSEPGSNEPPIGFIIGFTLIAVALFYLILPAIWLIFYAKFYRVAVGALTLEKLEFAFTAKTKDWLKLFIGDIGLWLLAALVSVIPIGLALAAYGTFDGFSLPEPGESSAAFESAITIGMVVIFFVPFSLVGPFLRYRHWAFFMRHMEAYGEIDIASLTQSETRLNKHGEGLLDALDVGAF